MISVRVNIVHVKWLYRRPAICNLGRRCLAANCFLFVSMCLLVCVVCVCYCTLLFVEWHIPVIYILNALLNRRHYIRSDMRIYCMQTRLLDCRCIRGGGSGVMMLKIGESDTFTVIGDTAEIIRDRIQTGTKLGCQERIIHLVINCARYLWREVLFFYI